MSVSFDGKVHDVQRGTGAKIFRRVGSCALALMLLGGPVAAGTLGLDVDLDVDIGHGGLGVDAGVGLGGIGVDASVGIGGGTGGPGGPGSPGGPGKPGVVPGTDVAGTQGGTAGGTMVCARDANETAYNGFVVRDRDGDTIGWVHGATVSPEGKVIAVRLQSSSSACYKLTGAGFRISGSEVWANVDASAFR